MPLTPFVLLCPFSQLSTFFSTFYRSHPSAPLWYEDPIFVLYSIQMYSHQMNTQTCDFHVLICNELACSFFGKSIWCNFQTNIESQHQDQDFLHHDLNESCDDFSDHVSNGIPCYKWSICVDYSNVPVACAPTTLTIYRMLHHTAHIF